MNYSVGPVFSQTSTVKHIQLLGLISTTYNLSYSMSELKILSKEFQNLPNNEKKRSRTPSAAICNAAKTNMGILSEVALRVC